MLTPLDLEGSDLTQQIICGEKADQLIKAKNIKIQCRARAQDESLELVLYIRTNVGRFEVGLALLPGRTHQCDQPFTKAMLRVFGKYHRLCLEKVTDEYIKLIKLHNLYQVE